MLNRKGTFRNMIIVGYTIMQLSLEMQKLSCEQAEDQLSFLALGMAGG